MPARPGGVEHRLHPAAQAARRLRLRRPDRLQHGQHRLRVDLVDRLAPDRDAVGFERRRPLRRMLVIAPLRGLGGDQRRRGLAERRLAGLGLAGGLARGDRVEAVLDQSLGFIAGLARRGERDARPGAEPHLALLAGEGEGVDPAPRLVVDSHIEPAAVGVLPAGRQRFDLPGREPVARPRHVRPDPSPPNWPVPVCVPVSEPDWSVSRRIAAHKKASNAMREGRLRGQRRIAENKSSADTSSAISVP